MRLCYVVYRYDMFFQVASVRDKSRKVLARDCDKYVADDGKAES